MRNLILIAVLLIAAIGLGADLQAQTILSSSIMEQTTLNTTAPCSFCAQWRYSRATQRLYRWNLIAEEWQEYGTGWLKDSLEAGNVLINSGTNELTIDASSAAEDAPVLSLIGADGNKVFFGNMAETGLDPMGLFINDIRSISGDRTLQTGASGVITLGNSANELLIAGDTIKFAITTQQVEPLSGVDYLFGEKDGYLQRVFTSDIVTGTGGSAFWEDASGTVRTVATSAGLDFLFGSTSTEDTGTSTEDQRFFFDNSKGALYAGEWQGTQADDVNRGFNSVNLTRNAITSGYTSASIGGEGNDVDGSGSVAVACDDCISDGSSANSVLTGKDARSTLENDHVHGGGGDLQLGHHQYRRLIAWKDHPGTGTAVMHLNGTNADLVIPNNTMWAGQCECSAIVKTGGTGVSVGDYKFYQGRFVGKNIAGSTSVQFINTTDALLDTPSFNSSALSIAADDENDALTVLIISIPGSVSSLTHITCTLHITETGY